MENKESGSSLALWLIAVVMVVGLIASSLMFLGKKMEPAPDTDVYQAVFLTNGQVYFGMLANETKDYAQLTDIYYLQVVTPTQGSVEDPEKAQAQQNQLTLVALGNELHGPFNEMWINKDHILFWENMKDTSNVSKAIKDHKDGKEADVKADEAKVEEPAAEETTTE